MKCAHRIFLMPQVFIINFVTRKYLSWKEKEASRFSQAWASPVSQSHLTPWAFLFAGIGMGMTVPISFAVFPSDDGSLQKKIKVWFRIPNQFQSNPPVPIDDSIKIEDRESITVYST